MDPETLRRLLRLQTTYNRLDGQIRTRIKEFLTRSWNALPNYRDSDIDRFASQIVPVVVSGERSVSQLTNTYMAQILSVGHGRTFRPVGISPDSVSGTALRGVEPDEVYRRPAVTLYTALSQGQSMTDAVTLGLGRLLDLAATDLQMAKTHTVQQQSGFRHFRRTLTGAENCALCAIASSHRYTRGDLMPIHPRCDCGVMPLFSESERSQPVDRETLEIVHRAVGSTRDLANLQDLIVTRTHGEYGPTLTWRGQHFDGPTSL